MAEARSALSLATRAREAAADALSQCVAAEAAASRTLDTTTAIARRLGVVDSAGAGDVLAGTGDALEPSQGLVPVARRSSGGCSIMSLPDVVLEQIFDCLIIHQRNRHPFAPRDRFPCAPDLRHFAFACRRFSKLLRESYIKEISVYTGL